MSEQEGYTYSDTYILRNKAGIHDLAALQHFEHGTTAVRIQELCGNPVWGECDLAYLQTIHEQVFWDVYEWADEIRKVDIMKGPVNDRTLFTFKEGILQKAQEIQSTIKEADYLRGMDKKQFSGKVAEVYADANGIHPFRGGSGRATHEFIGQLAKDAGYQLDYSKVGKQAWNEAAKEFACDNLEPTHEVFYGITAVGRAVALDKLATREALAKHLELDGVYKMLHDAHRAEQDATCLWAEISKKLYSGRLIGDGVTLDEFKRVIDYVAAYRDLMVWDTERLGRQFEDEVVTVSSHHTMFQAGDMIAVRREHASLDRDLAVGDRVTIQHDKARSQAYKQNKEPVRDRDSKDMQMERERVSTPR